jgi:GNAT superfamily N-acetyltransferase
MLWAGYLDFYQTALPEDQFEASFARLIAAEAHDFHGLIALRGEGPDAPAIGLAHYLQHRHLWRQEPVCYLQDLYVASDSRGTGAGRALIEAVYAAADSAGAPRVYWLTQDDNHTARKLYDRIGRLSGFVKYERTFA